MDLTTFDPETTDSAIMDLHNKPASMVFEAMDSATFGSGIDESRNNEPRNIGLCKTDLRTIISATIDSAATNFASMNLATIDLATMNSATMYTKQWTLQQ